VFVLCKEQGLHKIARLLIPACTGIWLKLHHPNEESHVSPATISWTMLTISLVPRPSRHSGQTQPKTRVSSATKQTHKSGEKQHYCFHLGLCAAIKQSEHVVRRTTLKIALLSCFVRMYDAREVCSASSSGYNIIHE